MPTFNAPISSEDKLLIHYDGRPDPHKQAGFDHVPPGMGGALGVSELRMDGFVIPPHEPFRLKNARLYSFKFTG